MFEIVRTTQFKKDIKHVKKRSPDSFNELTTFITHLARSGFDGIDTKYKPHYLKGFTKTAVNVM